MYPIVRQLTVTAVACLAAGGIAVAATSSSPSDAKNPAKPAAKDAGRDGHRDHRGHRGGFGKDITYSETHRFVDGKDVVDRTDVGTLTAVSAGSITVKRADTTVTIARTSDTKVIGRPIKKSAKQTVTLASGQKVVIRRDDTDGPADVIFVVPARKAGDDRAKPGADRPERGPGADRPERGPGADRPERGPGADRPERSPGAVTPAQ